MPEIGEAVPSPIRHVMTDGVEYELKPLGLTAWSEFSKWWNNQNGHKPMRPVGMDELLEGALTLQGMTWLVWWSLKDEKEGLKYADTFGLVGSLATLTSLFQSIADLPEGEESPDPLGDLEPLTSSDASP